MQRSVMLLVAITVLGGLGCGGGDGGAYGCDDSFYASCIDDEIAGTGEGQCADFFGEGELLVQACDDDTASRSESMCDPAASLGGCRFMQSGVCEVIWEFDPGNTPAMIEAACTMLGGEYIPVP